MAELKEKPGVYDVFFIVLRCLNGVLRWRLRCSMDFKAVSWPRLGGALASIFSEL